jgi:competence protein ComEC
MERIPALKVFIIFAFGILIASSVDIPIVFVALAFAALAALYLALVRLKAHLIDIILALMIITAGILGYNLRVHYSRPPWPSGEQKLAILKVESEPSTDKGRTRFIAQVVSYLNSDRCWLPSDFKLSARMEEDPDNQVDYGYLLLVRGEYNLLPQRRNPGGFDYRQYMERNEVSGSFKIEKMRILARGTGNRLLSGLVIPARRYIRRLIENNLLGDEAALLAGLALGERAGLSKKVQEAFSNTGTTHVLAVSGLHVVLVAFVIFLLLRLFRVTKRWAGAGTIAGLIFYTLLTGSPPSIVRATIMAVAVIAGSLFERQGNGLNMLGLAGLVILGFWPQALFDAGFQLSFAATAGILALTRPIQNILFRFSGNETLREWLFVPLAVSLAAQVFTAPFLAYHFHRIPLISLIANLIVVPLTNGLLAIGLVMSLLGWAGKAVIAPLAAASYGISWLSLRAVDMFDAVKYGVILWPKPNLAQILLYGMVTGMVFWYATYKKYRFWVISAILLLANVIIWENALAGKPELRVTFLDVGQGDAALVQFPNGRRILIDTGPASESYDAGERAISPYLKYNGISKIDEIMISHSDADHAGGLDYLLKHVKTGRLLVSAHPSRQSLYLEALQTASRMGIRTDSLAGYDTLEGIWPARGFVYCRPDSTDNGNESSLICYLSYGQQSFLFSGDMGPEMEDMIYKQGLLKKCTVLKVPHHGSHVNNSSGVIECLKPEVAVIQVGENNRFGHPSAEVVNNYRAAGSRVFRTDISGAIEMETDGIGLKVTTMIK